MQDYYSILKLELGASQESIKLAYRRLARQHHPDGQVDATELERKRFCAQMAQLNGAYAVLSNAKLRREYDQAIRILSSLPTNSAIPLAIKTTDKRKSSERIAPHDDDVDLILAREFSKQLHTNLLARHKGISWKEKILDGFDWGLEGSSWSSNYCVAGRGFGTLNPESAKRFMNYSEAVLARRKQSLRKNHFLFLLPFQRLYEWESVSAQFNRFFSGERHTKFLDVPVEIALLDARQGRTMRFGCRLQEKQLEEILRSVHTYS